jgi:ABC-type transporter Mla MlaB component
MVTPGPVYDNGVLRMTLVGSPPVLVIDGEIDEDTYPALVQKLGDLMGPAEIHLNLAGVRYCDLAGLRAMVLLTGASHAGRGRRVVLHEVPPDLQAVLGIVGWDSTPGLVLDDLPS